VLEYHLYERGITRVERALQLTCLLSHASQFGYRALVWSSAAFLLADANAAIQNETREERTRDVGVDYPVDRSVGRIVGIRPCERARSWGLFAATGVARPSSWKPAGTAPIKVTHAANVHSSAITRIDLHQLTVSSGLPLSSTRPVDVSRRESGVRRGQLDVNRRQLCRLSGPAKNGGAAEVLVLLLRCATADL
jgi:hypothetical protein